MSKCNLYITYVLPFNQIRSVYHLYISNVTAKNEVHRSSMFCCSIWRILVNFEKQHNFSVNLLVAAAVSSFLNRKSSISLKILCVKMKVFFSIQHATSSKIVFSSAICCVPYWTTLLSNSLRRRDADFAEQKRSFKGKVGQANDGQFFGETWANITKATFEEVALNFYDLGLLKKGTSKKTTDALLWQKEDFHYVALLWVL